MTYLYYKTSSTTHTARPNKQEIDEWTHMSAKSNWRITQLPNGFYQTQKMKKVGMRLRAERR
jgi:hypothetical protein